MKKRIVVDGDDDDDDRKIHARDGIHFGFERRTRNIYTTLNKYFLCTHKLVVRRHFSLFTPHLSNAVDNSLIRAELFFHFRRRLKMNEFCVLTTIYVQFETRDFNCLRLHREKRERDRQKESVGKGQNSTTFFVITSMFDRFDFIRCCDEWIALQRNGDGRVDWIDMFALRTMSFSSDQLVSLCDQNNLRTHAKSIWVIEREQEVELR